MAGEETDQARPAPLPARAAHLDKARETFLAVLSEGWSVTRAAKVAGVSRRSAYRWRENVDGFAALWDEAYEAGTDALEDVAHDRATNGHARPVYYQGKQVGTELVVSDRLAELMLRARRPNKYRDRAALEVSTDGRPSAERLAANRQPPTAEASEALATVAALARRREQEAEGGEG